MEPELKSLRIDRGRKRSSQPSRGVGPWIFGGVVLILVSAGAFYAYGMLNRAAEVDVVRVRAISAGDAARAGNVILNATGYIVAAHTIELGSKVVGKVAWIGVDKGDKVVKAGEGWPGESGSQSGAFEKWFPARGNRQSQSRSG